MAAEEATKDADRALEIAERNADAATAQVAISRETAELQLRPYLSCSEAFYRLDKVPAGQMTLQTNQRLEFTVKNFGQTPARRAKLDLTWGLAGEESERRESHIGDTAPGETSIIRVLTPGGLSISRTFGEDRPLICFGFVDFEDGFGNRFTTHFGFKGGPEILRGAELERQFGNRTWPDEEIEKLDDAQSNDRNQATPSE